MAALTRDFFRSRVLALVLKFSQTYTIESWHVRIGRYQVGNETGWRAAGAFVAARLARSAAAVRQLRSLVAELVKLMYLVVFLSGNRLSLEVT
jgi:hypothetical protein